MNQENGLGTNVGAKLVTQLGGQSDVPVANYTVPEHRRFDRRQGHNHNNQQNKLDPGQGAPSFKGGRYQYQGQGPKQKAPEAFGKVPLAKVEKILVKFSFFEDTHFDLLPPDIRVQEWVDTKKLLGDSYVDRGSQPIVARIISLGLLRRALANQGFYLSDVYVYDKTERHPNLRNYHRKKYAVTLEFLKGDKASTKLKRDLTDHLRRLANMPFEECFVWDNTTKILKEGEAPDMSVTVNCRNPLRECKKFKVLVSRNDEIQVAESETEEEKS